MNIFHYEPIDFLDKKSDVEIPDWKLNGAVQG